jgi:hypothetical protein
MADAVDFCLETHALSDVVPKTPEIDDGINSVEAAVEIRPRAEQFPGAAVTLS